MTELITNIIKHWQEIGAGGLVVLAAVGGMLKAVEALIQIIAPLTPWKWDDNLATSLGKLLAKKVFNKKVD